jgi:serine/threonine protein kinase
VTAAISNTPFIGKPRFGDYELIHELARGGMSVLYRAHRLSLKRAVAIKMILAGQLATEAEVMRF